MAASNGNFVNNYGQNLSIYFVTSQGIGVYSPVSTNQVALVSDDVDFYPPGDSVLVRMITDLTTVTGILQVEEDGNMVPYIINVAEHDPALVPPGGYSIAIPLRAGHRYRFKAIVAFSA